MAEFTLTPESLSMIVGIILSLLFSYVPGLNAIYAGWDSTKKSLVMLGLLAVTSAAIYGLSCAAILDAVTCNQAGLMQLIWTFILAIIANQSAYSMSPEPRAVREAKLGRN